MAASRVDAPRWVLDAVKDYGRAGVAPRVELSIDGIPYGHKLGEWECGWGAGASKELRAKIAGRLPIADLSGATTVLRADIGGFKKDLLHSAVMTLEHDEDEETTSLLAFTASALADKVELPDELSIDGWPPEAVARQYARRLPFAQSQIRIHAFGAPDIDRTPPEPGDERNTAVAEGEMVQALLDVVQSEVPSVAYDTARGFVLEAEPGTGAGKPISWAWDVGSREVLKWRHPPRVDADEDYSVVKVVDLHPDGSRRIYAERGVHHRGRRHRPFAGRALRLPFSDKSADAPARAERLAAAEARRLGLGRFKSTMRASFNPFLLPKMAGTVAEDYRDDSGLWHRDWLLVLDLDGLKLVGDAEGLLFTEIPFTTTRTAERRIPDPAVALPGVTAGSVSTGVVGRPFGEVTIDGQVYDFVDEEYIDETPPWAGEVTIDGQTYDRFDPDAAPALLGEVEIDGQVYDYLDEG